MSEEERHQLANGLRQEKSPCPICGETRGYWVQRGPNAVVYCDNGHYSNYCASKHETGQQTGRLPERSGINDTRRSFILERDLHTCVECGDPSVPSRLHVGHIISKAEGKRLGMSDEEIDSDDNLYAVCERCNEGRSSRSFDPRMLLRLMRLRRERQANKPQSEATAP